VTVLEDWMDKLLKKDTGSVLFMATGRDEPKVIFLNIDNPNEVSREIQIVARPERDGRKNISTQTPTPPTPFFNSETGKWELPTQ